MDNSVYKKELRKLKKAYAEIEEKNAKTAKLWMDDAAILKARMAEMRDTSREYSAINGQYIQIRKQLDRMLISGDNSKQKDDELMEFLGQ